MESTKDIGTIPLRHRLPNPTALFVGRRSELDWLSEVLAQRSVAFVHGPGGIGKTSIVLQTIHERFRESLSRALFVEVRPEEPTDQVRRTLARLMSQISGRTIDLAALGDDPEELTAAALDIADALELWVVLDDVHHADASEMNTLLMQLASYARGSRWLVTSRTNPKLPPLVGQTLELGGLGEDELKTLAHELDPLVAPHDIVRAVASAAGSPWLLQQHVTVGAAEVAVNRDQFLASLPSESVEFLRALSLLRRSFPLDVIRRIVPPPSTAVLAHLERRGLIQRDTTGYRLHDVVSGFLFPKADRSTEELERRAATALSELDDPEALLEAARILLRLRAFDALADSVERHADDLISSGFAPKLWGIIADTGDPRLEHWRLRCAAELGNPTALGAVGAPIEERPENTLAWAQTEYARGDVEKSLSFARAVTGRKRGRRDVEVTKKACLLEARCLMHLGQLEEAMKRLSAINDKHAEAAAHRDALIALGHALQGEREAGSHAVETTRRLQDLDTLPEATHELAAALALTGRFELADELLDSILATPRGGGARLLVARQALLLRARIRLAAGEADETKDILETIRPYVRGPSFLLPFLAELDVSRRLILGRLDALESVVDYALELSRSVDHPCWFRSAVLLERLKLIRGVTPTTPSESGDPPHPSADSLVLALVKAIRRCRYELSFSPPPTSPHLAHIAEVKVWGHLLKSAVALISRDDVNADREAAAALIEAERARDCALELEALGNLCDVLLCLGRSGEHEGTIERLDHRARLIGSSRFELEAAFNRDRAHPASLERLASAEQIAPVAARRAQALLGGSPVLDALDRRVVETVGAETRALGTTICQVGDALSPEGPWRPGWGIDEPSMSAWLPDGQVIDFSARPLLFRILLTLAERGGAAAKEVIFCESWQESDYHPLRHDSRLHVSIRKIRMELETDPSRPERLQTTNEGYRLGGSVRWVRTVTG